jgi:hypothetical protein
MLICKQLNVGNMKRYMLIEYSLQKKKDSDAEDSEEDEEGSSSDSGEGGNLTDSHCNHLSSVWLFFCC